MAFALEGTFVPIRDASEVGVSWSGTRGHRQVWVHLRGERHALLVEGEKPGFCRLARQDGLLAKALNSGR